MIIDLCDYLKDKPHISVSDNQHNYKNSLRFVDDNLAGFLFNIEVEDKFIIELIKESSNTIYGKYLLTVWSLPEDNNFSYTKENILAFDIKDELIKAIEYCEKYLKLWAFT